MSRIISVLPKKITLSPEVSEKLDFLVENGVVESPNEFVASFIERMYDTVYESVNIKDEARRHKEVRRSEFWDWFDVGMRHLDKKEGVS